LFSSDGAIPGSRIWSKVHKGLDVPLYGVVLSTTVCCLLGLIYFGSSAAFNSFTGVATICLGTSYAAPILVNVIRRRKAVKNAPYSLGKFGYAINIATIVWIAPSVVIFCMPTALPVNPETMNYASVVFAGFTCISAGWYFIRGRKEFSGPPVVVDEGMEHSDDDITRAGEEKEEAKEEKDEATN